MSAPLYIDFLDGNDSNTGFSEAQAFKTISRLVGGVLGWNGQVYVRSGLTTVEAPLLTGFVGISLRSIDFGSGSTALSENNFTITHPTGNARHSIFSHSAFQQVVKLEGVTIDGQGTVEIGVNQYGWGGVTVVGELILNRCVLTDCANYGAIARGWGTGSDPGNGLTATESIIQNCGTRGLAIFANNTANAILSVEDCIFTSCEQGMYSANGGGQVTSEKNIFSYCVSGIYLDGKGVTENPLINKSTFFQTIVGVNQSPSDSCHPTINSCIFMNSVNPLWVAGSGYASYKYSCFYNTENFLGTVVDAGNNITENPKLIDPIKGNFGLRQLSPCIDTGDPNLSDDPDGSRADMGAIPFTHRIPWQVPATLRIKKDFRLNWRD
jgi:hypothetical protein